MKTHAGNPLIGAVYRPGSLPGTESSLINDLSDNLDSVIQTTGSDRVMIQGDFNVHHEECLGSKSPTDRSGIACSNFCLTHGLYQLVKTSTRGDLVIVDSAA